MGELQSFKFNNATVRTVELNGVIWFVAKDIADVLEYSDTQAMTRRLDCDETMSDILSGMNMKSTLINESGLYNAVIGSNKPESKVFKKWITSEVLPAIRKHGMYATDNFVEKALSDPDYMIEILQKFKVEKARRIEAEKTNAILMHVSKLYTTTEIAKELNMRSANELNKRINDLGIQFNQNNTWMLYSKYSNLGYEEIKQEVLDNGKIIYHRKWTQRGREFILKAITAENK